MRHRELKLRARTAPGKVQGGAWLEEISLEVHFQHITRENSKKRSTKFILHLKASTRRGVEGEATYNSGEELQRGALGRYSGAAPSKGPKDKVESTLLSHQGSRATRAG